MIIMINIRKRGKVYQYCYEVGKVNGKREQITKCGFKTSIFTVEIYREL